MCLPSLIRRPWLLTLPAMSLFPRSLLLLLALCASLVARPFTVVAYNVENLFDLDGVAAYEEYQSSKYTSAHALTKLRNIASVLARYDEGRGPDILLLSEIEVDATPSAQPPDYDALLQRYAGVRLDEMLGTRFDREIGDLPAELLLAKAFAERGMAGYHVVSGEAAAAPGTGRRMAIKCVVFTRFPVRAVRLHPIQDARPILETQLDVDGAALHVFANHWKSGASDPVTERTRVENARILRARVDEILREDPNADLILGGDFNSQYNQHQRYPAMERTGIDDVLGARGDEIAIRDPRNGPGLYNLWYELPADARGSDTYRGEWGTLINLIISRGLYDRRGIQYVDNSFGVGRFPGLNMDAKGLPFRWSFDGPAGRGFSDHFPVHARFITVTDNRPGDFVALELPSHETPEDARPVVVRVDPATVATKVADLPPGSLRREANKGHILRVEGRVLPGNRLAVEFRGEQFDVHSFDAALREKLRTDYRAGDTLRFYGELGQYRDRWQFVIQDASWVK